MKARALKALRAAQQSEKPRRGVDLIALALHGRKVDFAKVIGMIDEMIGTLKEEQLGDDHKKEYCAAQFDLADDEKKGLERKVSDAENAIADTEEGIAKLKEEIAALET